MKRDYYGEAYRWLTADQLVNEGRTLLCQLIVNASADGGSVTIYDGLNANGDLVGVFDGLAAGCNPIAFGRGVCLTRGLFVDIGSNITGVTVIYRPIDTPVEELE